MNIIGGGLECEVYLLDDGRVYKQYQCLNSGDELQQIYERAKLAFDAGIGPAVYELVDDGYITEKVQILNLDYCGNCDGINHCVCPQILAENGFTYHDYNELKNESREIGLSPDDLHQNNIGIKNGKLVMIDFGDLST